VTCEKRSKRSKLHQTYHNQWHTAKRRGIPFRLTFDEWFAIWLDSGHLEERGSGRDQYVMARLGNQGAYEVGNVKIITASEMSREAYLRAIPRQ
jgi:hypothetical protein